MTSEGDIFLRFVHEKIRAEIGQVCVQWGMLETMIESAIWQAAKVQNDIGRTITSQLQMQSKIDLLLALLHQNNPKLAPYFDKVARYIRECLIGKRNLIIHGFWGQNPDDIETAWIVKFSATGKLTTKGKEFNKEELTALAGDIADVSRWVMSLSNLLPPLIKRPGGLGYHIPDTQNSLDCASRKALALQPIPSQE